MLHFINLIEWYAHCFQSDALSHSLKSDQDIREEDDRLISFDRDGEETVLDHSSALGDLVVSQLIDRWQHSSDTRWVLIWSCSTCWKDNHRRVVEDKLNSFSFNHETIVLKAMIKTDLIWSVSMHRSGHLVHHHYHDVNSHSSRQQSMKSIFMRSQCPLSLSDSNSPLAYLINDGME